MFQKSRSILDAFKQSRSWAKLNNQQIRTIFKYFKREPQERMDGYAKAKEYFKKVPREPLLAPRYRLRPYSPRYIATEVFEFCQEGKNVNKAILGIILISVFLTPFNYRRESEKVLMNYYHPEEKHEVVVLDNYDLNLTKERFNLDDPRIKYVY